MSYTKQFKELNKESADIAGGKGASLGEMINSEIPVPDGFVVLADTFEKFIKDTDLIQEIDAILDDVDHKAVHTVDDASEKIQGLIKNAEMPKDIADEVMSSFDNLDAEFVAVRSSATAEDGADHAWAGQLDSYLNITKDNVLEKVQHCWASLFTPRAIFYRFEKELNTTKISVAVVVQKMVNSELSGIAFSVHPVTEDRNQLIIEAGLGLGEAIVSGSVTPDSYVVEKEPRKILDINVSEQDRGLFRKPNGGNEWKDLGEDGKTQVLTEEQINELSEIILNIENHYGFPCDIEWAYEGRKFYIVQSRPITTLSDMAETRWYDKYDWKPVAQDFNSPFIRNYIWVNSAALYKNEVELPKLVIGIKSDNNSIEYLAHVESWGAAHEEIKRRVEEDYTYVERELIDKTNKLGNEFNNWSEKEIFKSDLTKKDSKELIAIYNQFIEKQSRMYAYGITLPTLDLGDFAYIEGNLEKILREKVKSEDFSEYYALFTEPSENSFAQDQEQDLLKLIQKYYKEDWKKDVLFKSMDEVKEKYPDFWSDLNEHTEKHSWVYYVYAGPAFTEKEFFGFIIQELKDDELPDQKLKRISEKKKDVSEKKEKIIAELDLNDFEENILRLVGKFVWAKPRRKDYQSRSYYHLEKLQNEISSRLKIDLDQVRSTPVDVLEKWLSGEPVDIELSNSIKKLHVVLPTDEDGVELFYGEEAEEFMSKIKRSVLSTEESGDLKGNTAYRGKVSGKVKVINKPEEMDKMEDGDILVSVATTPSIVPVMRQAAAIVTDEGGLTCHAAIVSRELETPCVVGTKIATQILKDGDMVEVDADRGTIKKVS